MRAALFIAVFWVGLCSAALSQPSAINQWTLPNGLQEISGLALASPETVFAHNDEYGIVYEIELTSGDIARAFALGDPTIAADFEGIAVDDGRVYLITSEGMLYEADIGDHRGRVRYNVYDTGIGDLCEVEGLSRGQGTGEFLVLCKEALKKKLENRLLIYKWRVSERRAPEQPWLDVPFKEFLKRSDFADFRAAGLEWDQQAERLVIISSRSSTLYFFDEAGVFEKKMALPKNAHAQSEGVSISATGDLIIADEGAKRGPGRLSIYADRP